MVVVRCKHAVLLLGRSLGRSRSSTYPFGSLNARVVPQDQSCLGLTPTRLHPLRVKNLVKLLGRAGNDPQLVVNLLCEMDGVDDVVIARGGVDHAISGQRVAAIEPSVDRHIERLIQVWVVPIGMDAAIARSSMGLLRRTLAAFPPDVPSPRDETPHSSLR